MSIIEDENIQKLENKVFLIQLIQDYFEDRFKILDEKYNREAQSILVDFDDSDLLKEFYIDIFNKLNTVFLYMPTNANNIKPGHFNHVIIAHDNFEYCIDEILKSPLSKLLLDKTFPSLKGTLANGSPFPYSNLLTSLDVTTAKVFIRHKIKILEYNPLIRYKNHNDSAPFKKIEYLENFKTYVSLHILDPYLDYSYLFQRLKYEGYIEKVTHFDFMDWLLLNEIISEKVHNEFFIKRCFYSLGNCNKGERINNFNNIFKL